MLCISTHREGSWKKNASAHIQDCENCSDQLTIPRSGRGEEGAARDVDVAAASCFVFTVNRGMLVFLKIVAHVQRRCLVNDAWHADLRRCCGLLLPTGQLAICTGIVPELEEPLASGHDFDGIIAANINMFSRRRGRRRCQRFYSRSFVHNIPQVAVDVVDVDLKADVRRHIGVLEVLPDPRMLVQLRQFAQRRTDYAKCPSSGCNRTPIQMKYHSPRTTYFSDPSNCAAVAAAA